MTRDDAGRNNWRKINLSPFAVREPPAASLRGVSSICGPAAPACAVAVVLLGSMAGGIAGSVVADTFDEELEELSHWEVF